MQELAKILCLGLKLYLLNKNLYNCSKKLSLLKNQELLVQKTVDKSTQCIYIYIYIYIYIVPKKLIYISARIVLLSYCSRPYDIYI